MTPEFTAIVIMAGILGPLQIAILVFLWNLAGRIGKVEGLLEAMLASGSPPARG